MYVRQVAHSSSHRQKDVSPLLGATAGKLRVADGRVAPANVKAVPTERTGSFTRIEGDGS